MHIDYAKGCYWAHDAAMNDAPAHAVFQEAGWRWIKSANAWMTGTPTKALPFRAYARGEALDRLTKLDADRQAALAASCALTSDITVKAPPGCAYRPYQLAGIEYTLDKDAVLLADDMRLGKSQSVDCPVLTPTGWRTMGDLAVGDFVIGSDGCPTEVVGVYPQGLLEEYEVTTFDGASATCSGDHLWSYITSKGNLRTITTKDMIRQGLSRPANKHACRFIIPTVRPVNFVTSTSLPVDPYLLGVLIGDGYLCGSSIAVSVPEHKKGILEFITAWAADNNMIVTTSPREACPQYRIVDRSKKGNSLLEKIRALGLAVKSVHKKIPPNYMVASVEDRLALLRGLMDTDGCFSGRRCTFSTSSSQLAENVVELVRSLGGVASLNQYDYPERGTAYCVRISLDVSPFRFRYGNWSPPKRVRGKGVVSIRPTGRTVAMLCIAVSASDRLYVTKDYLLTHNTIQAIGVMNTFEKPEHILVICPSTPKRNWYREIKKWLVHDLEVGIVDGKKNPETPVLIINYDILHTHKEYLDGIHWDIIICDESHYLKNSKARRTKMVFGYQKKFQSLSTSFWLFMSGSQMFKTPVDLFTVVQKCDPQGLGKSWWDFVHRYCDAKSDGFGLDTSGASNLEELQYMMRTRFMCRRTKKDVAGDMPSNRQTVSLPRSGLVDKLVKQERDEVEKNFGAFSALIGSVMSAEAIDELFTEYSFLDGLERGDDDRNVTLVGNLAKIRRELAVAKTPMCIDFINDLLESEDKVVVFAHHRDVIDLLKEAFPTAAVVRGGMADKVKDAEVTRFQTDPACRVFIGNIVAAGQAINLSVADVAVFIEISWVPSEVSQAEERIWDVLKTRPNTIYRLPVEGSLDEAMIAVVEQRQEDVNKAMNMEALT